MNTTSTSQAPSTTPNASKALILLLGLAVGVIAANLYYAQPLIALIASSLGLDPAAAGLIVTLTQVGYGIGVLFIVPLGDLVENRKLILTLMVIAILALLGLALSSHILPYFLAALATGIGACSVQIIVPYAAHLTPEATRGRVVGSLMSGLMLGIMLSRPIASILTDLIDGAIISAHARLTSKSDLSSLYVCGVLLILDGVAFVVGRS